MTIFNFERFESEPGLKLLDAMKGQVTDNRNLALTKRIVLNCSLVVWRKANAEAEAEANIVEEDLKLTETNFTSILLYLNFDLLECLGATFIFYLINLATVGRPR